MAHTRRLSVLHGLLLTLLSAGATPLNTAAQTATSSAEEATPPIVIDMAAPLEPERPAPPPTEPSALGVYRNYIASMESSAGAFAPGLTEQLLGLGLNLQALDRHGEAVEVLKRGVHVSRVQSGLYAADQIPLLRAEIRSLSALGRFNEVDERQRYLARVEADALAGTPASISALLDQGEWAERAWQLKLGDEEAHLEHLARSWEYYRLAFNQSTQVYGEQSLELLKPLEGMLRLQYRFASEQRAEASNVFDTGSTRQASMMGGTYRRGEAVLSTIAMLKKVNGVSAGEQAYDLTRLGDWAWWLGRRSNARNYYDQAWLRITPPPTSAPESTTEAGAQGESDETNEAGADGGTLEDTRDEPPAIAGNSGEPAPDSPEGVTTAPKPGLQATESAAQSETAGETGIDSPGPVNAESDAPPADSALAMAPEEEATPEPEAALILEPEMLSEDDPVARAALFATATPLPDVDQLRPLPPFRADASGPLVVQFQINSSGKITDLEQVAITTVTASDESEADTTETAAPPQLEENPAVDRLLRKMRRIRFRPAYKAGEAVETDMIVWSFDISPTRDQAMALQP